MLQPNHSDKENVPLSLFQLKLMHLLKSFPGIRYSDIHPRHHIENKEQRYQECLLQFMQISGFGYFYMVKKIPIDVKLLKIEIKTNAYILI